MQNHNIDRESLSQGETAPLSALVLWEENQQRHRARAAERRAATKAATRAAGEAERTRIAREKARDRQRKRRAGLEAAKSPEYAELNAVLGSLEGAPVAVDEQRLGIEEAAFRAWMATTGHRQGQFRKRDISDLMVTRRAYLQAQIELGGVTSWQGYADRFQAATGQAWSRHRAKRRAQALASFEAEGGPWQA